MPSVQTSEHLTRSVLLEIAKKESPELQRELLQKALQGTMTVRALREKIEPTPARTAVVIDSDPTMTYTYKLEGKGSVRITLPGPTKPEGIVEFLQAVIGKIEGSLDLHQTIDERVGKEKSS